MNRRLVEWTRGMSLPWYQIEIPGRGHGGATPPRDLLLEILSGRREHYPRLVEHNFRHLHQGQAYWLEAETWQGERWGGDPIA